MSIVENFFSTEKLFFDKKIKKFDKKTKKSLFF